MENSEEVVKIGGGEMGLPQGGTSKPFRFLELAAGSTLTRW